MTPERSCLLLSPSIGFDGGIERVVQAIAEAWPGPVNRIDLYARGRDPQARGGAWAKIRFVFACLSGVVASRPDQIVCGHVGLLPVAVIVGGLVRRPVTLFAYGTEVWAPMSGGERYLVRSCTRLVAISRFTARWLAERAGVSESSVVLIHLPIAQPLADASRVGATRSSTGNEAIVLTVSRLDHQHRYKGHWRIAEAWPQVIAARPDAHWLVIGDGDDVDSLVERCSALGIKDSVTFRRSVSDEELAGAYAIATVHVLPSTADVECIPPTGEGFGLVYAEAAAFGVPSIAAVAGGGATDIVEDGVTGITVEADDPDALADAIVRLLEDRDLRNRLGTAVRQRVLERHLPDRFRQLMVETFTA